jgi:CubicO group peptidase (beta-lactamase class C family)
VETPIGGRCDTRFRGVREAFAENFETRGEVGAAVCVIVDGREVVDLHGGWRDADRTRPWAHDTIVNFYSVGKAMVGLLLLQQIDRGAIDLDAPIASLWPEFAASGKETATIRHALCHQAGVPAITERLTNTDLFDWSRMCAAVAATPAWFPPGSRHVYHTNTYGHLVGELVRRSSAMMPGDALRSVAGALDSDVWFGVPVVEQARCAEVIWGGSTRPDGFDPLALDDDNERLIMTSYMNPPGYSSLGIVNTAAWRGTQVPSTNGHGSASGVARIYAALLEPDRLLSGDLLSEATRVQSMGYCPVLDDDVVFGLGFKPTTERRAFGPNHGSFGHYGSGGAVGFADPEAGVAVGYVMNHVIPRWQSTRNRALIDAVYSALELG